MFLHLSNSSLRRLRVTPLSGIPELAYTPDLLRCAFAEGRFTWPAFIDSEEPEALRMLTLIALQPKVAPVHRRDDRRGRATLRSYR